LLALDARLRALKREKLGLSNQLLIEQLALVVDLLLEKPKTRTRGSACAGFLAALWFVATFSTIWRTDLLVWPT
jgi:hypothetical protein